MENDSSPDMIVFNHRETVRVEDSHPCNNATDLMAPNPSHCSKISRRQ
jgi:hypothetical protein